MLYLYKNYLIFFKKIDSPATKCRLIFWFGMEGQLSQLTGEKRRLDDIEKDKKQCV